MKYKDLKIIYKKPKLWKRPSKDKLPKEGKPYLEYLKEIKEFESLKSSAKDEICSNITKAVKQSTSRNDLNQRLDELFSFYGKAVIPSNELEPDFLLRKTNQNTLNKKLQPWCRNLVFNIPEIVDSKPFQGLAGKFNNITAFIVLAGPSLKNNREKLKKAKGKSLIIAVDTSLRPLLDVGVVPDIVVTHDANPNGCKFFLSADHEFNKKNVNLNDMPDEQLGLIYLGLKADEERLKFRYDTIGLFVNYCHPLTLLAFNGREKRFYGVYDPNLPVYEVMASASNYKMEDGKLIPENKGRVVGGSSVGHVAAYIAVQLGCNPICFLGLDLSYPGGKTYIEGASNQKDVSRQKLIDVDDLSGHKVKTNLSMLSYKMVFERTLPQILLQKPDLEFFNCTEDDGGNPAGIMEVAAQPKPLDWVIENKCKSEVNINEREQKK